VEKYKWLFQNTFTTGFKEWLLKSNRTPSVCNNILACKVNARDAAIFTRPPMVIFFLQCGLQYLSMENIAILFLYHLKHPERRLTTQPQRPLQGRQRNSFQL